MPLPAAQINLGFVGRNKKKNKIKIKPYYANESDIKYQILDTVVYYRYVLEAC
jgi:hypothetical protein